MSSNSRIGEALSKFVTPVVKRPTKKRKASERGSTEQVPFQRLETDEEALKEGFVAWNEGKPEIFSEDGSSQVDDWIGVEEIKGLEGVPEKAAALEGEIPENMSMAHEFVRLQDSVRDRRGNTQRALGEAAYRVNGDSKGASQSLKDVRKGAMVDKKIA